MKKVTPFIPMLISYFFTLLFSYAAISKLLDFENFQVQLAQSPLLSAYAGFVSYAIIVIELITAIILCITKTRLLGLYASLSLMCGFTIYIYLILNFSDFVPCSCGGILEKLGWREHLIFNMGCVVLAIVGIFLVERQKGTGLKRFSFLSAGTGVASCLLVIIMFIHSEYIIKKENNFTRRFLLNPIIEDKVFDMGLNSYYFSGYDNGQIYMGNITAPLLLTTLDTALTKSNVMRVYLDKSDYPFRNLQLKVKGASYYLYDGSVPIIYRGYLGDSTAKTISYNDAYFTQLAVIDTMSFALRSQSRQNLQYIMANLRLNEHPKLQMHSEILQKQIDGVFDSDGKLIVNQSTSNIIYIYAYRNQFIVMDQEMQVLKKLNTIDTTTVAKIQTRRLSNGIHKMSAPPLKVNNFITANRNVLFNWSELRGKHESREAWKRSAVVDMYRIDRAEYIGSFYVENRNGHSMSQILATDNYLYVLSGNELIRYRFRQPIADQLKTGVAENLIKE